MYVADRKERDCILRETFERAMKDGKKPYLVPYGGSNATGALGYAFAMKELIDQKVSADWIVFGLDRLDLAGWDERIRKSRRPKLPGRHQETVRFCNTAYFS